MREQTGPDAPRPAIVVDAGDLLAPYANLLAGDKEQRRMKAELILETLAKTRIDALTVGRPDFAFGVDFLVRSARAWGLPYVCANLRDRESGELIFPASTLLQAGSLRVGVLGIVGTGFIAPGLEVVDPISAAREAVDDLRTRGADLVVALANQSAPDNDRLARKVKGIDIIVAGSSHRKLDPPLVEADTLILEPGSKGKYLGVLELYLHEGAHGFTDMQERRRKQERAERFRHRITAVQARLKETTDPREQRRLQHRLDLFEKAIREAEAEEAQPDGTHRFINRIVPLARTIPDDPEVARLVNAALQRMSRATRGTVGESGTTASPSPFVGADACADCHELEYAQWKETPHAGAYQALEARHRQLDYQCFGCHVTGHDQPGGPSSPLSVGFLRDVQCEACHGPRKAHVEASGKTQPPPPVDEALCRRCHTEEQTRGQFDFVTYLPRVDHSSARRAGTPTIAPEVSPASPGQGSVP